MICIQVSVLIDEFTPQHHDMICDEGREKNQDEAPCPGKKEEERFPHSHLKVPLSLRKDLARSLPFRFHASFFPSFLLSSSFSNQHWGKTLLLCFALPISACPTPFERRPWWKTSFPTFVSFGRLSDSRYGLLVRKGRVSGGRAPRTGKCSDEEFGIGVCGVRGRFR